MRGTTIQDGSTPLHLACTHLKLPLVNLLLRHDADETAVNYANESPGDVIAFFQAKESRDRQLVHRIKLALLRAPLERAWRRRGWIVMARSRVRSQKPPVPAASAAVAGTGDAAGEQGGESEKLGKGATGRGKRGSTRAAEGEAPGRTGAVPKICRRNEDDCVGKVAGGTVAGEWGRGGEQGGILVRIAELDEDGIFQKVVLFL